MYSEPDVVIVGAGAAGIAAARRLAETPLTCELLEARDRVGGRAWTDGSFAVPVDLGCFWLWHPSRNSIVQLTRALGRATEPVPQPRRFFVPGREATAQEAAVFETAESEAMNRIAAAEREGRDGTVADIARPAGPCGQAVANLLGPWMMGEETARVAVGEWFDVRERERDRLVPGGIGTLLAEAAAGLPLSLDTEVTAIDYSGDEVRVETTRGSLRCGAVIVTLPFGVLAAESVRFTPGLPADLLRVVEGLAPGLLMKIVLEFERPVQPELPAPGLGAYDEVLPIQGDARAPLWVVNLDGAPLAVGYVGGDLARELEDAGEAAAVDFGRAAFRDLFGADCDKAFRRGRSTDWGRDPFSRGAYTVARPGMAGLRGTLPPVIDERLFFAGEGCAAQDAALVNGAYDSGLAAAERVIATLKD